MFNMKNMIQEEIGRAFNKISLFFIQIPAHVSGCAGDPCGPHVGDLDGGPGWWS